jgi:hypothetical protein
VKNDKVNTARGELGGILNLDPESNEINRAIIYTRSSALGTCPYYITLKNQYEICQKYADDNGLNVIFVQREITPSIIQGSCDLMNFYMNEIRNDRPLPHLLVSSVNRLCRSLKSRFFLFLLKYSVPIHECNSKSKKNLLVL